MTRRPSFSLSRFCILTLASLAALSSGCASQRTMIIPADQMPRELTKTTMPDYVIEPPDVLQIDLISALPKPPYRVQPLDIIGIRIPNLSRDLQLSANQFQVEVDGSVNLGTNFGTINVGSKTLEEIKEAIETVLKKQGLTALVVATEVTLLQGRGLQQVRGPHLVRPDGTIGLGNYGAVRVVGMTLPQAKQAIEGHLSAYFQKPEISLEISGFNSKVYYMILDGGGVGQQVSRQPITGNETVLDAVSNAGGLSAVSNASTIWVARPSGDASCPVQTLPVDWAAITEKGDPRTNYQLLPGDRLFVKAYPLVTLGNRLDRVLAPIERALGATLLGVGAYQQIRFIDQPFGLGGFGGGVR